MKMTVGPYYNSPYDASGMPLGAKTVDYDKAEDVAKATVKDKVVKYPKSINDIDYEPKQMSKKFTGTDRAHGLPHGRRGFNSAVYEDENPPYPTDVDVVDFDDPDEKRKLAVKDAFDRDHAVMELPKTEKPEVVKQVAEEVKRDEIDKKEQPGKEPDRDFLDTLDDRVAEIKKEEK